MTFQWPELLWLLALVPLLVALYFWVLGRKKKFALRYASLDIVKEAMGSGIGVRRHIPPLLFLLGLTVLLLAVARPMATVLLPSQNETIILAMDVSGSMRATDVEPNRLVAAQNAAKAFVAEVPESVRIGVVAFAGTATVAQAPTRNKEDIVAAIDRFQLQRATAIGSAILVSLATLFPNTGIDVASFSYPDPRQKGSQIAPANPAWPKPVAPGSYNSAVIILLTDGQRTTGPDPIEAAKMAADRGVRVYTVGVGTKEGETIGFEGWSMRVRLDEDTLKGIANLTRADYFYAGTAEDLKKVYQGLSTKLIVEKKETEVSALFAAFGALLVVVAASLSVWWFGRVA